MEVSIYEGQSLPNWRECTACSYQAEMALIGESETSNETVDGDTLLRVFKILQCRSCNALTVVQFSALLFDDLPYRDLSLPREVTYHEKLLYSEPRIRSDVIPSEIADVTTQAEKVANVSPRAAVILCRAALEEICRERGVPSKGSLQHRIDELITRESLGQEIREIVHAIRLLGNEGAHGARAAFSQEIRDQDVEDLIGLVDYVLDRLYIEKARTKRAAERLAKLQERTHEK